jgi:hypothetical protein
METSIKKEILSLNEIEDANEKLLLVMEQLGHEEYVKELIKVTNALESEPRLEEYQQKLLLGFTKFYSKSVNFKTILLDPKYKDIFTLILSSGLDFLIYELSVVIRKNILDLYEYIVLNLTNPSVLSDCLSILFYFIEFRNEDKPKVFTTGKQIFLEILNLESQTSFELFSNSQEIYIQFSKILQNPDSIIRMRALELVVELTSTSPEISQLMAKRGIITLAVKLYNDSRDNLLECLNTIEVLSRAISVKVLE